MATKRGSGHGFSRSDRVAEQIRRELADLLRFHLKDQRIAAKMGLVTLSSVEVTPTMRTPRCSIPRLPIRGQPAIAEGLARSASFLRRELGQTSANSSCSGTAFRLRPLGSGGGAPFATDRRRRGIRQKHHDA
jgi:ribosome-binding factor A